MTEYERFIEFNRTRDQGEYTQKHHIIPRSCGGSDYNENKITLSWLTHYYAHMLLAKENPDNKELQNAFNRMGDMDTFLHKCYELYKREKEDHPLYGKHHSEETKQKISESLKKAEYTKQHRENLSKAMVGNQNSKGNHWVMSDETKKKISDFRKEFRYSEESKKKMSESQKLAWARRKQKTS